jgi:beta-N-acetylhexosaminidase
MAGRVMLDVGGTELDGEDRDLLAHPLVDGLILFSRNHEEPDQLRELVRSARRIKPELLVAVDQEGGRVQRLRDGLTRIPPMAALAQRYADNPDLAQAEAAAMGRLMAEEVRQLDIDISFAPVLDLDHGCSTVIGDRSFGAEPETVTGLATAWIAGMDAAGMAATGKHFPGHGAVDADSHTELPVDERSLEEIRARDLRAFADLAAQLEGIMPAHVLYPAGDDQQPAGFSPFWLGELLRGELGYQGVIFSDDLAMTGAAHAGGPAERAEAALEAGCDRVLLCNDRAAAISVIEALDGSRLARDARSLERLRGRALTPMAETVRARARELAHKMESTHG